MRVAFLLAVALLVGCRGSGTPPPPGPASSKVALAAPGTGREWKSIPTPDVSAGTPAALDLATTPSGTAALAWIEARGGNRSSVFAAIEDRTGTWRQTPLAARLGGRSLDPHLACGGDHVCTAVWTQASGQGAVFSARYDNGTWELPSDSSEALSFLPHAYDPRLAAGADGETLVVWSQDHDETRGIAIARRRPDRGFVGPRTSADLLSPKLFFTNDGKVALNRRGDALVSWYQSTGGQLRVFVSERRRTNGCFSRPVPGDHLSVDTPGPEGLGGRHLDETYPAIADSGAAIVLWEQPPDGNSVAIFAAFRDSSGHWQRPGAPADSFSAASRNVCCPRAAFSRRSHLYVVWLDEGSAKLAHRLPDGSWTASGRQPITLSADRARAESLEVAVGPGGSVAAVWSESGSDGRRIVARWSSTRRKGPEAERWSRPATLSAHGDAYLPRVAVGGRNDRVVVAWIQSGRIEVATSSPRFSRRRIGSTPPP